MSDPIEDALSRMKPAKLAPDLMARLTAARAKVAGSPPERAGRSWWAGVLSRWLLPATACAAVAAATVAYLESGPKAKDSYVDNTPRGGMTLPASDALPFESEDRLLGAREVGIVTAPHVRPFRLMEVEWLESDTLQPRDNGSAVRVETTRRQVLPVALEIY